MRPIRLMKTRCGFASSSKPMAGFAGSNTERPAWPRNCATVSWSSIRTHRSACSAPRPRSNRIDSRCSGFKAARSAWSSVSTVRRFIAQPPICRHSATLWLQLALVMHSNANGRQSSDSSMAMPPRVVTAAAPVADCVRRTISHGRARIRRSRRRCRGSIGCGFGDLRVQQIDRRALCGH